MIPIIGITGKSGSGKTYLMLKLIEELKTQGLRLAALKHTHREVEYDTAGKDSYLYAKAGSDCVGLLTPDKLFHKECFNHNFNYDAYFNYLRGKVDVILAEGFKEAPWKKFEVLRQKISQASLLPKKERLGLICDFPHPERNFSFLQIKEVADLILKLIKEGKCSYV
jgi:molybdopterin-guanine dinucleotide biosynthesis adapter protein